MSVWIRVESSVGDSAKVRRFAAALKLPPETAVGLLVMLWGQVAEHASSGDISGIPDELIEEWARWRGKRSRFATAYRQHFAPDGLINDWAYHQGALIRKREKDNARPPSHLRTVSTANNPSDSPEVPERERNGKNAGDGGRRTEDGNVDELLPSNLPARLIAKLAGHPSRYAVIEFLEALPPRQDFETWALCLNGCLEGLGMDHLRKATVDELATACNDYRATPPGQWGVPHFRSFVDRIVAKRFRPSRVPAARETSTDRALEEVRRFVESDS